MLSDFQRRSLFSTVIDFLLFAVIIFSPLLMPSVRFLLPDSYIGIALPFSLLEAISFFILYVFLLGQFLEKKISFVSIPSVPLFLFLALLILQLLPFSQGILGLFSPATISIYKGFRLDSNNFFTLSVYSEASITWLLLFLSYLAIFFVVLNHVDNRSKCKRIIWIIIFTVFAYAFYGILHKLSNLNFLNIQGFSTFVSRNMFAAYLEMVIPLVMGYSLVASSFNKRLVLTFIGAILILTLFFTSSRAGRVCFGISSLIFFGILFWKIKNLRKKLKIYLSVLLVFLLIFASVLGFNNLLFKMDKIFSSNSNIYRTNLSVKSIQVAMDFPVFGTGLGNYWEVVNMYLDKTHKWNTDRPFAYNETLQLIVETGLIGFLLIALFIFFYLRRIYNKWCERNDRYVLVMSLACFIGMFSILLHSFYQWVFHLPANAFMFFIILALTYRIVYLKENRDLLDIPKQDLFLTKNVKFVLILVLSLSIIFIETIIFRRYQAQIIFERIGNYNNNYKIPGSSLELKEINKDINLAIRLNSANSLYWRMKADFLTQLALSLGSDNNSNSAIEKEALFLEAKSYYKKAINLNPTNVVLHLKLGELFEQLGENELMLQELKKINLLEPYPRNKDIINFINKFSSANTDEVATSVSP